MPRGDALHTCEIALRLFINRRPAIKKMQKDFFLIRGLQYLGTKSSIHQHKAKTNKVLKLNQLRKIAATSQRKGFFIFLLILPYV